MLRVVLTAVGYPSPGRRSDPIPQGIAVATFRRFDPTVDFDSGALSHKRPDSGSKRDETVTRVAR
jgi:hypothetical protein